MIFTSLFYYIIYVFITYLYHIFITFLVKYIKLKKTWKNRRKTCTFQGENGKFKNKRFIFIPRENTVCVDLHT
jgi:hypothetical protein